MTNSTTGAGAACIVGAGERSSPLALERYPTTGAGVAYTVRTPSLGAAAATTVVAGVPQHTAGVGAKDFSQELVRHTLHELEKRIPRQKLAQRSLPFALERSADFTVPHRSFVANRRLL